MRLSMCATRLVDSSSLLLAYVARMFADITAHLM